MTRRRTILATVGVAATAAAFAAPLASAAPSAPTYPPPCPTQPLVWQSNGTYYVSIPDPSGKSCRITVALNTNIHKPGTGESRTEGAKGLGYPPPCPVQPLAWTAPDGNIVVSLPDPTGQRCRDNIELPIGLPPT